MKAILMSQAGDPDVLTPQNVPIPTLKTPTQLLIRLKAAGINPIDTKIRRRGTFYPEHTPAILGCDGSGIVAAIGEGVTDFKVGDEVYFFAGGLGQRDTGNYAEYTVIEQHLAAFKPKNLSFTEAAAAPLVLITAWEALYDRANLSPQQTVLIHAGTGGVGHVAIQLAKLKGAKVATTVGNPDKERLARQLRADCPILYKNTDFAEAVLHWTEGQGVDVAFDTVGGSTFFETVPAVKVYGDLVTILEPNGQLGTLKAARNRNLRISLELMLTPSLMGLKSAQIQQTAILKQCATWFEEGKLSLHLSQTFPLEEAYLAHKAIETGSTTGKIVLFID
ncbi:MAG: zinc-dependent alcohol dehydrogenase family protein [Microcystaceae cyanobacterium]